MATTTKLSILVEAIDKISEPSVKMRKRLEELGKTAKHIGDVTGFTGIHKSIGNVGQAFGKVRSEAGALMGTVAKLGATGAAAGYLFHHQFLKPAIEFERLSTQMETIAGSSENAKTAMDWVQQFAVDTPFNIKQTADAFIGLRKFGIDPMAGSMKAIGNAATALDMPLERFTKLLSDASIGKTEELGAVLGITTKKDAATGRAQFTYKNKQGELVHSEVMQLQDSARVVETLSRIIEDRYGGAMKKFNKTFAGSMSNIGDVWEVFRLQVMRGGLFEYLSQKAIMVAERLSEMLKTGELQKWADMVGGKMLAAAKSFFDALPKIIERIQEMSTFIQDAVKFVGGWENALKIVAAVMVGPLALAVANFGKTFLALNATLVATPLGRLILAGELAAAGFAWIASDYKNNMEAAIKQSMAYRIAPGDMSRASGLPSIAGNAEPTFAEYIDRGLGQPAQPLSASRGSQDNGGKIEIQLQSDVPLKIRRVEADGDFAAYLGQTSRSF